MRNKAEEANAAAQTIQLEKEDKGKEDAIEELKHQLEDTLKENSRLIIDLETSHNSLEALTKEHLKGKETEAKVEELAELVLSRDESIEKLTLEIKRYSDDSDASLNAAMEKNSQLKEDIGSDKAIRCR